MEAIEGLSSPTQEMVYVKKWVRTRHAVVFRMSNRMYQVNFFDNSMVVLSVTGGRVAYFSKGKVETHTLHNLEQNGSAAFKKRFNYAKEVIVQLANNGSAVTKADEASVATKKQVEPTAGAVDTQGLQERMTEPVLTVA